MDPFLLVKERRLALPIGPVAVPDPEFIPTLRM
jgi:hypothetical protein